MQQSHGPFTYISIKGPAAIATDRRKADRLVGARAGEAFLDVQTTGRTSEWRALLIIVLCTTNTCFCDWLYSRAPSFRCQWREVRKVSREPYTGELQSSVYGRPQSMEEPFTCTLSFPFLSSVLFGRKDKPDQHTLFSIIHQIFHLRRQID